PDTSAYFTNDTYVDNNLWGDFQVSGLFSGPLVAPRASTTDADLTTSGKYTFYGRSDGFTAVDHRQPLPTKFAAHFRKAGGKKPTTTTLIVWRDPKFPPTTFGFTCGQPPTVYPLDQDNIVVFDEQEQPQKIWG